MKKSPLLLILLCTSLSSSADLSDTVVYSAVPWVLSSNDQRTSSRIEQSEKATESLLSDVDATEIQNEFGLEIEEQANNISRKLKKGWSRKSLKRIATLVAVAKEGFYDFDKQDQAINALRALDERIKDFKRKNPLREMLIRFSKDLVRVYKKYGEEPQKRQELWRLMKYHSQQLDKAVNEYVESLPEEARSDARNTGKLAKYAIKQSLPFLLDNVKGEKRNWIKRLLIFNLVWKLLS